MEGCSFCNQEHEDFDHMNGISGQIMRLETSQWNDYYDCQDWESLDVEYCPMCGRKLGE